MNMQQKLIAILLATSLLPMIIISMIAFKSLIKYHGEVLMMSGNIQELLNDKGEGDYKDVTNEVTLMVDRSEKMLTRFKTIIFIIPVICIALIMAISAVILRHIRISNTSQDTQKIANELTNLRNQIDKLIQSL